MCIVYHPLTKFLFAGYKNGNLAAWLLKGSQFEEVGLTQFHTDVYILYLSFLLTSNQAINKIVFKEAINQSVMFTCSSDGFLRLWSINEGFKQIKEIKFDGVLTQLIIINLAYL